ncbi:transglycosylase SLT domain-containing protein [Embleya sp. NBC_00896]|uniref:aggregation-promoting factor C-terminal-like domain-containing protein n=1 Tax=Embleya sp. NBC_00896 TaxID=2975961 RepID=UPI0038645B8C|nr:transglycosylase SLT domain-containing protein [Embleya sp. NBC_00896]
MSRISVRGIAVASATAVTAVGAVVGLSGTGVSAPAGAQTVDEASTTKLLEVPAAPQAQELSTGIIQQADAQTAAYDEAQRVQAEEAERQKAEREAAEKAAAEKAAAEKAAAEKAAADKAEADRKAAQERAARSENRGAVEKVSASAADAKAIAQSMMSAGQYTCFSNIVERESGWRVNATNPSSGAYGLVQALPGTKMATAGADWKTNPATQIKWGLNYMNQRYGSPCGAWSFWQSHHWY